MTVGQLRAETASLPDDACVSIFQEYDEGMPVEPQLCVGDQLVGALFVEDSELSDILEDVG